MYRRRQSADDMQQEILRRMGEPEHLRKLRQQAEQIEAERRAALDQMMHDAEADRLRADIKAAGRRPVA